MLWKRSKLEKRIRDIERERARLDHEIKALSRRLDKKHLAMSLLRDGGDDMDASRSGRPYVDGTTRRAIGPRLERADTLPPGGAGAGAAAGLGPYVTGGPAPKSLRRERHLQRNKAIFMLIVVIVVAIILYRIMF